MPLRLRQLRFRPRWWGALLMAAVSASTIALGHWQTGRAQEKEDLAQRFERARAQPALEVPSQAADPGDLVFRHLSASGEFLPQFTILLDNKVHRGRPGYFVVTPLRLGGGPLHVLVNRGWIPAGARREDLPQVVTPPGPVTIEGFGQEHAPRVLAAGAGRPSGRVWPSVSLEDFAGWSGLKLQPVFLEQHSALADGLVREWPAPDFGIERHRSYALQWYLIAALSVAIFLGLSLKHG